MFDKICFGCLLGVVATACTPVTAGSGPAIPTPAPSNSGTPTGPHTPRIPNGVAVGDATSHVRLVASYDGTLLKVLSVSNGQGPPRSYLSGRADVVVLMKSAQGKVLQRIALADPLERRAWSVRQTLVPGPPGDTQKHPSAPLPVLPQLVIPVEHVEHVSSTTFDVFLPLLSDAQSVEFHRGGDQGPLLATTPMHATP